MWSWLFGTRKPKTRWGYSTTLPSSFCKEEYGELVWCKKTVRNAKVWDIVSNDTPAGGCAYEHANIPENGPYYDNFTPAQYERLRSKVIRQIDQTKKKLVKSKRCAKILRR